MKKIYIYLIVSFIGLIPTNKTNAQCTSSGAKNGSVFTNVTVSGTGSWNNPSNVATSNSIPSSLSAMIPAGDNESSNFLYVQGFGFNIPSNAVICGITVKVEGRQQGADGLNTFVKDNAVYLLKGNSITGTNHAFPWNWSSSYSNTVHGNMTDTWGAGLTAADINSPGFGVAVNVKLQSNCCDQTLSADIDHVSLTVFYTIPLPVEITNINIYSPDHRKVLIEWETMSENNNQGFIIERSRNAIDWEEVQSTDGIGNSNSVVHYSLADEDPYTGVSYYRIKQTDLNGGIKYYEIKSVEISDDILIRFNGNAFEIIGIKDDQGVATVFDCTGKIVLHQLKSPDDQRIQLETAGLLPGIYIVIVETPTQKKVQKLHF